MADPSLEEGPSGRAAGPQAEGGAHARDPELHRRGDENGVSARQSAQIAPPTLELTVAAQVGGAHLVDEVLRGGRGLRGRAAGWGLSVRSRRRSRIAEQGGDTATSRGENATHTNTHGNVDVDSAATFEDRCAAGSD